MTAWWLNTKAHYSFYWHCIEHHKGAVYSTDLSDDAVGAYCAGGEL